MRILLLDGDVRFGESVKKGLEEEAYIVDFASEGQSGFELCKNHRYDLIILDLLLPKADGIHFCQKIRSINKEAPILILTSRGSVEDKVKALDAGADDYLTKPIAFTELIARVRALLRVQAAPQKTQLQVGDLVLDLFHRTVTRDGEIIELTAREFALLEYMMRNAGYALTRTMIAEHVLDINFDTMTNVVDVHINHLRKKLEEKGRGQLIHTIRGVGYTLRE
jgi:DNA-binding response OmpR family regulator